jgi:peptide-methionine (S)-S-oxide reductase
MSFLKHNSYKEVPMDCEYITFGMGCFWGAEKRFWEVKGLKTTVVGYSGGKTDNPTYEEVCSGQTGHAEVVRVILEKKKFSWDELFQIFWESHDPTQLNRQGNDIGTQYRSAIFVKNEKELQLAINSKEKFQEILNLHNYGLIKTEIKIIKAFYYAEEYHQKYLYKNPNGYCGLKGLEVSYS